MLQHNESSGALAVIAGTIHDSAKYNSSTGLSTVIVHRYLDAFGASGSYGNFEGHWYDGGPFIFTGRFRDAMTGLQWNLHRWYDYTTGRWLSEDPIGFRGGDSNLYRYVGNSPLMRTDPSGLIRFPIIQDILDEADRRRGRGPWGDSAQHCWAACYFGAVLGSGTLAALYGDIGEYFEPSDDTFRDIVAQHAGGGFGDAIHAQLRLFLGPLVPIFLMRACAAKMCDAACLTSPR
jgi:RHS repeat-associated protein